jgi:hypothetical protein
VVATIWRNGMGRMRGGEKGRGSWLAASGYGAPGPSWTGAAKVYAVV